MINADMRIYNYFTIGTNDNYGQPIITKEPVGKIKIAINISSQSIQDNVLYKDCSYIGLTQAPVNDTYVIDYNGEKLKVLYVNTKGRYTQVFLKGLANG
jgi:hypothetical protein